jgi:hypothetical protein
MFTVISGDSDSGIFSQSFSIWIVNLFSADQLKDVSVPSKYNLFHDIVMLLTLSHDIRFILKVAHAGRLFTKALKSGIIVFSSVSLKLLFSGGIVIVFHVGAGASSHETATVRLKLFHASSSQIILSTLPGAFGVVQSN